ncbi:MAG TPA: hypothetical protein VL494_13495 [Steroidobacteraceae bacterium]|jgi:hypothetical protein|nr:hypothetical protein [Steroidobacteraceae bacterium]
MVKKALTGLMLLTATAYADAPSAHVAWTRAALARLPIATADRSRLDEKRQQLDALAVAMAHESETAPVTPRQWVAVLGAIGFRESTLSLDVQAGICLPHQCDALRHKDGSVEFRARSGFQLHLNDHTRPVWGQLVGLENTAVQVAAASKMAKVGHYRCARLGVPFPASVFRGYSGASCSWEHPGEKARIATYNLLLATPGVKANGGAS